MHSTHTLNHNNNPCLLNPKFIHEWTQAEDAMNEIQIPIYSKECEKIMFRTSIKCQRMGSRLNGKVNIWCEKNVVKCNDAYFIRLWHFYQFSFSYLPILKIEFCEEKPIRLLFWVEDTLEAGFSFFLSFFRWWQYILEFRMTSTELGQVCVTMCVYVCVHARSFQHIKMHIVKCFEL